MATKSSTETVRFRHWVSDTACYKGEAGVTTYTGSHTTDEFGIYDGDDYDADLDVLYFCEEGETPREVIMAREIYPNPSLYRALKNAAIESIDYPTCLPVIFPGELAPKETIDAVIFYQKAA